jgi:hypothetical protein
LFCFLRNIIPGLKGCVNKWFATFFTVSFSDMWCIFCSLYCASECIAINYPRSIPRSALRYSHCCERYTAMSISGQVSQPIVLLNKQHWWILATVVAIFIWTQCTAHHCGTRIVSNICLLNLNYWHKDVLSAWENKTKYDPKYNIRIGYGSLS